MLAIRWAVDLASDIDANFNFMRRIGLVFFLIMLSVACFAQKSVTGVQTVEKNFGAKLPGHEAIKGIEHLFTERIHDSYFDTTSNTVTLQLRGTSSNGKWLSNKGLIILYDLTARKVRWQKSVNYNVSSIEQLNSLIVETVATKSHCLDIQSGKPQWEVKNSIYYLDHMSNVGLGYVTQGSSKKASNKLAGINLSQAVRKSGPEKSPENMVGTTSTT